MLDNHNNSTCPREDKIVSYLYRELTAFETEQFEAHLASCGSCVDELAAVSEPHLSVYEWRTNIFDNIPAPFVDLRLLEDQRPPSEGVLGRLTAALAGWPVGLRVGVGFATILVLGFSTFLLRPFTSTDVAQNQNVFRAENAVRKDERTSVSQAEATQVGTQTEENEAATEPTKSVTKTDRVKHRPASSRNVTVARAGRTEFASNSKERSTTRRSLRLNSFEEDDDTTLRLAELLEEVGSL